VTKVGGGSRIEMACRERISKINTNKTRIIVGGWTRPPPPRGSDRATSPLGAAESGQGESCHGLQMTSGSGPWQWCM